LLKPNKQKNKANIVLSNLDALTENTLAYFINSNLCQNAKLALSNKNIHIYIIDLDKQYDAEILNNAEAQQQYIIGIYINEAHLPKNSRLILVKKPLNVTELKDAIDSAHSKTFKTVEQPIVDTRPKIVTKIKHKDQAHRNLYNAIDDENAEDDGHLQYKSQRYVGNNKDINPEKDDLKHIYFKTDKYFYFHLIKAVKSAIINKTNTVIKSSLGSIAYDFHKNSLNYNIGENRLKLLQTTPLISPVSVRFNKSTSQQSEYSANATNFIWETCIKTSKGRLPESTNLTKPVVMSLWPNFSQLKVFRHAIPIAAVWSRQRISLIETADLLNIPQRYVFSLYTAMNTLDYAKIKDLNELVKNNTRTEKPSANSSKLFGRILGHIFKRKS